MYELLRADLPWEVNTQPVEFPNYYGAKMCIVCSNKLDNG